MKVERARQVLVLLVLTLCLPACDFDLDLAGLGGSGYGFEIPCTPPGSPWEIRGFGYQHFSSPSAGLLTATIRRGETVELTLSRTGTSPCEGTVVSVQWISTAPNVASVEPIDLTKSELRGLAEGETEISAEITFADGLKRTAELFAVPTEGSPRLQVYSVRVVRR